MHTIEFLVVILFVFYSIRVKSIDIICLIFLLLPIHGTIKNILFWDNGSIFAIWKELCILILLFKNRRYLTIVSYRLLSWYIPLIIIVLFYFIIGYSEGFSVVSNTKKLLFPCLLTISIASVQFNISDIKKLVYCICLSTIIIDIPGILEFFLQPLRILFRGIMHTNFVIADDGNVYYDISSYTIMGIERACGLMEGGPNQFGVFNSVIFCIIFAIFHYFCRNDVRINIYIYITLFVSAFSLLLSFSRAGWAMLIIAFVLYSVIYSSNKGSIFRFLLALSLIVAFFCLAIPELQTVLLGTFNGTETSSASRKSMTEDSFDFLLANPTGFGIGASDQSSNKMINFAESSFLNFGFDIGVFGVVYLSLLIFIIVRIAYKKSSSIICNYGVCYYIAFFITGWVSVNVFETPFIYYPWMFIGLALADINNE